MGANQKKCLNFPRPKTVRALRSFLGLINYFKDQLKDHSTSRVMPLKMLSSNRHQVLNWNEDQTALFEEPKREISECPKVWFVDANSPIHLETDASDYGCGRVSLSA